MFHQHLNSHIAYPGIPPEPSNHTRGQFFATVKVAGLLQEKGTTLVGIVRANVKGIPKEITKGSNEKFACRFFLNDDKKCMLVNYQ